MTISSDYSGYERISSKNGINVNFYIFFSFPGSVFNVKHKGVCIQIHAHRN